MKEIFKNCDKFCKRIRLLKEKLKKKLLLHISELGSLGRSTWETDTPKGEKNQLWKNWGSEVGNSLALLSNRKEANVDLIQYGARDIRWG